MEFEKWIPQNVSENALTGILTFMFKLAWEARFPVPAGLAFLYVVMDTSVQMTVNIDFD